MLPRIVIRPYVAMVHPDVQIVASDEVAAHFWVPLARACVTRTRAEHVMTINGARARFPGFRVDAAHRLGAHRTHRAAMLSLLDG
jgi:hypothetical protein